MRLIVKVLGVTLALSAVSALAADPPAPNAGMPPVAKGAATARADNTDMNVRDKSGATQTPQKQSNNAADRKILAAVRRAVEHDKTLSSYGHNVKIVTEHGVVTLRGPVRSDDEKGKIEQLAMQVAGVASVSNQLDVKTK